MTVEEAVLHKLDLIIGRLEVVEGLLKRPEGENDPGWYPFKDYKKEGWGRSLDDGPVFFEEERVNR